MKVPYVSIAMPVRNSEQTVAAAVRSILKQSLEDWELILIDDGSSDGTLVQLRSVSDDRIKIFHDGKSKGLPARLNEAISFASGEYLARMDGDDVSYPKRLELQLEYLRAHPEVDLLGGGVLVFGGNGRVVGKRRPPEEHEKICRKPYAGMPMAHPTFLGRTAWFRRWRFKPTAGGACDQDLLLRSNYRSKFANLTDLLLGYREDTVRLRKCWGYRVAFARSLLAYYGRNDKRSLALGVSLLALKATIEAIAVCTGLQHRILRHRALPASRTETAEWGRVWHAVNTETERNSAVEPHLRGRAVRAYNRQAV